MAAPHVTGTIALMLQKNPFLTSSELKSVLINTAALDIHTGGEFWNRHRGFGKLDALAAVNETSTSVWQQEKEESASSLSWYADRRKK